MINAKNDSVIENKNLIEKHCTDAFFSLIQPFLMKKIETGMNRRNAN